jgi:ATP-dependent DNA helicase RecQ
MVKLLMSNRISCGVYHGGLTKSERERMLNDWMSEKRRIMVATNAFGMGIDRPNVRFVLHYEIPSSLEAYFQEAGRGGRDGEIAKALLFFEDKDTENLQSSTLKKFPAKTDVLNTYRAISNFLKIAIGSGKDEAYPLDLKKMCQVYKLDYETTFHSLRILELNENLLFSEGTFHPTKLRFLVTNRELYNFQIQYESTHPLSTLLTRSYPGIFEYFHVIHEDEICKRLKINSERLTHQLEFMQQHGIIDLNLRSSLPTVTYITERLPDSHIYLKPSIYKERRDIAIQKADGMIQFCQKNECRTQQVIAYFGQTSDPCGTCDVCQKNTLPIDSIPRKIIELLEKPMSLKDLSVEIKLTEKETEDFLREFLKNEIIIWMDGKFYLN